MASGEQIEIVVTEPSNADAQVSADGNLGEAEIMESHAFRLAK